MRKGTCLTLSGMGRVGRGLSIDERTVTLQRFLTPRGEMLGETGSRLIFRGVRLSELHDLREIEDGFQDEGGELHLSIRQSQLEEFHRELGEFLAKQKQPAEPPAT